jgi:ABC-type uncharacterized transport system substrate-binding protein
LVAGGAGAATADAGSGLALPEDSTAPPEFLQGLQETGYVDGQNVRIEYRWTERVDQMSALATELVRRQPKVIFAYPTAAALALKTETATIPIVFSTGVDPVNYGLVASLNRPGGNATGTTILAIELGGKRLELLHQLVPTTEVIAALVNPQNPSADTQVETLQDAGRTLGRRILIVHAATVGEIIRPLRRWSSNEPAHSFWVVVIRSTIADETRSSHWRRNTTFQQCILGASLPRQVA